MVDRDLRVLGALALPLALDLALLCFLDTLLTALVVDKLVQARDGTDETTDTRRELAAQGLAGAVSAVLGGLPGAQATVRSVLIVRQGATMRLAGMAAGMFVLAEGLVLHGLGVVTHIPEAVFGGVHHAEIQTHLEWCRLKAEIVSFPTTILSSPEAFTTPRYGPVSTDAKLCLSSSSAIE